MSIASDVGGAIGLLLGLCGINLIEMVLLAWDVDMFSWHGAKSPRPSGTAPFENKPGARNDAQQWAGGNKIEALQRAATALDASAGISGQRYPGSEITVYPRAF